MTVLEARGSDKGTRWTSRANSVLRLIRGSNRCCRSIPGELPPVSRSALLTLFPQNPVVADELRSYFAAAGEKTETAFSDAAVHSGTQYVRLDEPSHDSARKPAVAAATARAFRPL